ncbi:carboxylesterase family protein [Amycolatopsis sp. FDAARGOS 1241]|uniref:carboxylesterase family protein n=1 Tax=Amycolatopsis sp. FDAARGOS 1241 TaxID=2778070 RepID=UPI0021050E35|nr:carboxylesterase family protein [Amycolatopsis sp. FDAARGOS 1241]
MVQRAIMESSSCSAHFPKNTMAPGLGRHILFTPLAQARAAGTAAAAKFGCTAGADVLACLRRVPAKAWLDGDYTEVFTATPCGTPVLPAAPETAMREGRIAAVPVLFGTNRDELCLYVAAALATGAKYDEPTYRHLLADTYGAAAQRIAAAYPLQGTGPFGPGLARAAATTDEGRGCATAADARALASAGRPVFTYLVAAEARARSRVASSRRVSRSARRTASNWPPAGRRRAQRELSRTVIGLDPLRPHRRPERPWPAHLAEVRRRCPRPALAPGETGPVDAKATFRCAWWNSVGE